MSTETSAEARRQTRLETAFAEEERRAQAVATRVLAPGFALITALVTYENGFPGSLYFYPFIFAFALLALAPGLFRGPNRRPPWAQYVRFGLGVAIYTALVMSGNPFNQDIRTPAMMLRWQNELYLFVFVGLSVFTYSPRVVLFTGVAAAICWSAAGIWTMNLPQSHWALPGAIAAGMSERERQLALMDPNFVLVNGLVRTALVLLIVSAALAAFVQRSRRMVLRQADAERQRVNLSRYFSPNVVDELAQSDLPLSTTRRQQAAVLFVDIIGFTAMSEREDPEAVIRTLREFHRRVERDVFAHHGTLEKYIGDGAMATFGTPTAGNCDATNALLCARALRDSLREWNAERQRSGQAAVRVGIGAHYGTVVLGDIGGEQHLEFAVVGDTVNVASRLERLTRELGSELVVSGDLIDAAQREGCDRASIFKELREAPSQPVRGREGLVRLWVEGTDSTSRSASP